MSEWCRGASQIQHAIGWKNYWDAGGNSSPDYYNSCANYSSAGVPNNLGGYQYPANGNAYAGIYTFESDVPNVREYIGAQLLTPLVINTKYYFSFKANLALDTNHIFNQAANNLGLLFSTVSYSSFTNPIQTNNFAHIYSAAVITDTANWTTISGSFIADSAYQYIIIGNFFDDANTTFIQMQDTVFYRSAYFYIDDAYVSTDSIPGGIAENDMQGSIITYPNPFTQSTSIEINCNCLSNDSQLTIINVSGIEVKRYMNLSPNMNINRDNLLAGIYFLKLQTDNKIFINKLIIQ